MLILSVWSSQSTVLLCSAVFHYNPRKSPQHWLEGLNLGKDQMSCCLILRGRKYHFLEASSTALSCQWLI